MPKHIVLRSPRALLQAHHVRDDLHDRRQQVKRATPLCVQSGAGRHDLTDYVPFSWKCQLTYKTGRCGHTVLLWHDAFVIGHRRTGDKSEYRVFVPVDGEDESFVLPDDSIAFRCPKFSDTHVSQADVKSALAVLRS